MRKAPQRPNDEYLRDLTRGSSRPMEVPILMLQMYVDESGHSGHYVVCGLLARAGEWDPIFAEWNEVLARNPPLPYWHQGDAYAGKPPFKALSSGDRRARAVALAGIVARHAPLQLQVAMPVDLYERHMRGRFATDLKAVTDDPRSNRGLRLLSASPYHLLHFGLIEQLKRELSTADLDEGVRLEIEQSDRLERDEALVRGLRQVVATYVAGGWRDPFSGIGLLRGKRPNARGLEAADLVAWSIRRRLSPGRLSEVCQVLEWRARACVLLIDQAMIEGWVAAVNEQGGSARAE